MYAVILAGGSGTRFWPKSREQAPKQLLRIVGPGTMLQNTVARLLPKIPVENLFVVSNEHHGLETCRQLSTYGFPPSHLLTEPVGKNTAAAIGFAARVLFEKDPDEIMGVFPADHVITDPEPFYQVLKLGEQVARSGHLVTLGIEPSRPETGYGYIKKGPPVNGHAGAFHVDRFVEKPDAATAEKYKANGGYLWNSGMFLWKVSTLLEELKTYLPELYNRLDDIVAHTRENKNKYSYRMLDPEGRAIYETLPSVSIDYGIMEKSKRVTVLPAQINWSDVGAWNALEDVAEKDSMGNVIAKNVVSLDCSGSIIQGEGRLIAAIGLKDIIVVDTEDALLVCRKDRAQDVKKVVEQLKKEGRVETRVRTSVQKPWGSYTVLEKGEHYLVKRIEVSAGEKLSLQSHTHRNENWTVVSGKAEVLLDEETFILNPNESIFIPKKVKHRLGNPGDTPLTLIEVQTGNHLDEKDIIRHEDLYGRANK